MPASSNKSPTMTSSRRYDQVYLKVDPHILKDHRIVDVEGKGNCFYAALGVALGEGEQAYP